MALSSLWNKKIVQSKKSDDNAISFLKKYGSVQTSLIFSRQFLISYLAFYPFELITLLFKYMAYPVMTIDSDLCNFSNFSWHPAIFLLPTAFNALYTAMYSYCENALVATVR